MSNRMFLTTDQTKLQELEFIDQQWQKNTRLQHQIRELSKFSEDAIIELIDQLGENCFPEHKCRDGYTALMDACRMRRPNVAIKLIDTFGKQSLDCNLPKSSKGFVGTACLPSHNIRGWSSLIFACQSKLKDVVIKLIETFDEACLPGCGTAVDTPLTMACSNGWDDVVTLLVQKFGDGCKPEFVNGHINFALAIGFTYLSKPTIELMLDTFGEKCIVRMPTSLGPEYVSPIDKRLNDCRDRSGVKFFDWYEQYKQRKENQMVEDKMVIIGSKRPRNDDDNDVIII